MAARKAPAKKKGPKGKKARAKAKLERHWGETTNEEEVEASRVRRGKSRLLPPVLSRGPGDQQQQQPVQHRESNAKTSGEKNQRNSYILSDKVKVPMQEESSDSDDESENVDNDVQNGALSQLLQSIGDCGGTRSRGTNSKKVKTPQVGRKAAAGENGNNDESSNGGSESEMDAEGEDDRDESSSDQVDESDKSVIEEELDEAEFDDSSELDLFSSHFNRDPLPKQNEEFERIVNASQQTTKVPVPMLSQSLDIQLSASTTNALNLSDSEKDNSSALSQKWLDTATSLFSCNRKVLKQGWRRTNSSVLRRNPDGADELSGKKQPLSSLQCALYPSLAAYADVLITAGTRENRDALNNITYLHLLNHVLTARGRVLRNNKKAKQAEEDEEVGGEAVNAEKLRDQGFTRPCVLILLPTRGTCHTFLKEMLTLLHDAAYVDKMDRFETEYGPPVIDEGDDDTNGEKVRHRKAVIEAKGSDWQDLFGDDTNDDDDFKIGITITPRAAGVSKKKGQAEKGGVSVKLYSDFYRSDIIIASPLGLKISTDATEDEEPDIDFLSSIEICLVSRSDMLLMQNWDHVNAVLDRLNKQPKKNNDTDFSRVRNYLLTGQAEHWRQLIVTSSFSDPHILSTFKRHAKSIGGRLKLRRRTPVEDASLCNVLVRAKQVFQRISCNSFATQGTDRLRFFEQQILPQIRRQKQKHTMIFIPSYFDFVSVRNLLMKSEVDFVSVTEYARVSEVSRGRARFLQGSKPLLLYTGRAHFFSRHTIKGVRHLILFGLPEHGEFYSELVNMLNAGLDQEDDMEASTSCLTLFTKFDALALERIVGNEHCNRMIKGEKSTFMFCS